MLVVHTIIIFNFFVYLILLNLVEVTLLFVCFYLNLLLLLLNFKALNRFQQLVSTADQHRRSWPLPAHNRKDRVLQLWFLWFLFLNGYWGRRRRRILWLGFLGLFFTTDAVLRCKTGLADWMTWWYLLLQFILLFLLHHHLVLVKLLYGVSIDILEKVRGVAHCRGAMMSIVLGK